MKRNNKIVVALLTLTCIFGLTACGSEEQISDFTQQKITYVEDKSDDIVNTVKMISDGQILADTIDEYNNIELGDMFTSVLYQTTQINAQVEGKAIKTAITSFQSAKESIGDITEFGEMTYAVDDDTIIVYMPVACTSGEGEIELIYSNDIYTELQSCTFNVNQSMAQLMEKAALNTLLGMGTVFVVLILISLIISCFSVIPKIQESFKKKNDATPETKEADTTPVVEEELADDTELVAVIAAAIAAYEGTSTDGFVVRSIKRTKSNKWNKA